MTFDAEKQRMMDEAIAGMRDLTPRSWRALYVGCLAQDFTPREAFDLVKTHIISQSVVSIYPNQENNPQEPQDGA